MVKSGTVTSVNYADKSGIIEDKNGNEYFFSIFSCCEDELPTLWSRVTFIRDPDFKSTLVATLIKRSNVGKRAA